MSIDFEGLSASLLTRAESLLPSWLPAGKFKGVEFVCGNLSGDPGDSLSINTRTGVWKDFASDDAGADLVSLYAAINHIGQADAAKALGATNGHDYAPAPVQRRKPVLIESPAERPPPDAGQPPDHHKHGKPAAVYEYRDSQGVLGYVCRYETAEGKTFSPYRWMDGKWQAKSLPKPRPLYGLHRLQATTTERVLVVEGEKAADAALTLGLPHVVVSWSGGANAVETANWESLVGRKVDLWPDNDDAGRNAMARLAPILHKLGCEIRTINPTGQPEGWDVADAVAEGWTRTAVIKWVRRDDEKYLVPFKVSAPEPDGAHPLTAVPSLTAADNVLPASGADLFLPIPERLRGQPMPTLWGGLGLDPMTYTAGSPACNEDTVVTVINNYPGMFWYDEFLQRPMTLLGGNHREFDPDRDCGNALIWFQRTLKMPKMKYGTVRQGIEINIFANRRNVAQDWMHSLKWDGIERLHLLMHCGFGAEDNLYHQQVGRNFIMAMAHRIIEPGCKADYMPVFEGIQGRGKSTALSIIGGEWYSELHGDITSKDFKQDLQGKMLIELSELSSFRKSEVEALKGVITDRVDRYRESYGRRSADYPRQCVLAGTTNRDDWNKDDTGARRFWRVKTGTIDLEWLRSNREQLFAEAVARVKRGEQHHVIDLHAAETLQRDAMVDDVWHSSVVGYISGHPHVRIEDILQNCLDIPMAKQDHPCRDRVRSILKLERWVTMTIRKDGRTVRVYRPPSIADDE